MTTLWNEISAYLSHTLFVVNIPQPVQYQIYALTFNFDLRCESCILIIKIHIFVGTMFQEPGDVIYHPGVTTLPIELTCDLRAAAGWSINGDVYFIVQLESGIVPDHNVSGGIILINNPLNNSEYFCSDGTNNGGLYRIFIAGEYDIKF